MAVLCLHKKKISANRVQANRKIQTKHRKKSNGKKRDSLVNQVHSRRLEVKKKKKLQCASSSESQVWFFKPTTRKLTVPSTDCLIWYTQWFVWLKFSFESLFLWFRLVHCCRLSFFDVRKTKIQFFFFGMLKWHFCLHFICMRNFDYQLSFSRPNCNRLQII